MSTDLQATKLITLRLSERADHALRAHVERRGDVTRLINDALLGIDWMAVSAERRPRSPAGVTPTFIPTTVNIDRKLYARLAKTAQKREVSTISLIDAIIIAFYGVEPDQ